MPGEALKSGRCCSWPEEVDQQCARWFALRVPNETPSLVARPYASPVLPLRGIHNSAAQDIRHITLNRTAFAKLLSCMGSKHHCPHVWNLADEAPSRL